MKYWEKECKFKRRCNVLKQSVFVGCETLVGTAVSQLKVLAGGVTDCNFSALSEFFDDYG